MPSKTSRSTAIRIAAALFVTQLFGAASGLAFNRSSLPSTTHSQPVERGGPTSWKRTIVAIGDLHGDLEATSDVLALIGVLKPSENSDSPNGLWNPDSGIDVLVQVGDIVDRGDESIEIFGLFSMLRSAAEMNGASVVSLYGNHELQNLYGDWSSVGREEITNCGGIAARMEYFRSGAVGKDLRDNYHITARVPLHPAVGPMNADYDSSSVARLGPLSHAALSFVHGGLDPELQFLPYPSALNDLGKSAVVHLQDTTEAPKVFLSHKAINKSGGLTFPSTITAQEKSLLLSDESPLWFRGWAHAVQLEAKRNKKLRKVQQLAQNEGHDAEWVEQQMVKAGLSDPCPLVEKTLAQYGIRRMIMGHTPDTEGIVHMCDGKVIVIDTGMTDFYGGVVAAVKFEYTLEPIESELGWYMEREKVTAIYDPLDRESEVIADTTTKLDLTRVSL